MKKQSIEEPLRRIIEARHHDPFEVLGRHLEGDHALARVFLPQAEQVRIDGHDLPFERIQGTDIFEWHGTAGQLPEIYRIAWTDANGNERIQYDPYCFPPQIEEFDIHLFNEGRHWHVYRVLGAHLHQVNDIEGLLVAVWAPTAERVSVIGDFNDWDGRTLPMRARGSSGVWELFLPGVTAGSISRFEIRSGSGDIQTKNDPYANPFQVRPENAE